MAQTFFQASLLWKEGSLINTTRFFRVKNKGPVEKAGPANDNLTFHRERLASSLSRERAELCFNLVLSHFYMLPLLSNVLHDPIDESLVL